MKRILIINGHPDSASYCNALDESYKKGALTSEAEIKEIVKQIITETGASTPADMGKVMGAASKQLAGKADGKTISAIVKELLAG